MDADSLDEAAASHSSASNAAASPGSAATAAPAASAARPLTFWQRFKRWFASLCIHGGVETTSYHKKQKVDHHPTNRAESVGASGLSRTRGGSSSETAGSGGAAASTSNLSRTGSYSEGGGSSTQSIDYKFSNAEGNGSTTVITVKDHSLNSSMRDAIVASAVVHRRPSSITVCSTRTHAPERASSLTCLPVVVSIFSTRCLGRGVPIFIGSGFCCNRSNLSSHPSVEL